MKHLLIAALFGTCLSVACAAQQQGSISGTVTTLAGEPVKSVTLTLTEARSLAPDSPPRVFSASSYAKCSFIFEDLEPGPYFLSAYKTAYLPAYYHGDSKNSRAIIEPAAGQSITDIVFKMTPQAILSGTVTDEDGEPLPMAQVVMGKWEYLGGRKRLRLSNSWCCTNADGVFSIGNLEADTYYVRASPQMGATGGNVPLAKQRITEESYQATYYPGVTDPSGAVAVQVSAGMAMRGVDIRMRKARAYRIHGHVVAKGTSAAGSGLSVHLASSGSVIDQDAYTQVLTNGTFDFKGVLPGSYVLETEASGLNVIGTGTVGRQAITLADADLEDVALEVGPGAEIAGKILLDGQPSPQAKKYPSVHLTRVEGYRGVDGVVTEDGTFQIQHITPAVYRVAIANLPPGTYVKSIRFGSQDITNKLLDLTASPDGGSLDILLSSHAADVSGIVRASDGSPLAELNLTLWQPGLPGDGETALVRYGYTDFSGRFEIANLSPGEYRIAAWEGSERNLDGLGPFRDLPEFRARFDAQATTLKLNENDHAQIQPILISRDNIEAAVSKVK